MIGGMMTLTVLFPFNYRRVMLAQMKGMRDFYRDFSFYLIPVAIYRGLYFGIFDSIKTDSEDKPIDSTLKLFAYGFSSTLTAQVLSAPFESAKFKILKQK